MPTLKTAKELGTEALTLARSFSMVFYNSIIYIPTDFETGDSSVTPDVKRTIWVPMSEREIQRRAQQQFDTLFNSPQELASFVFKVEQTCIQHTEQCNTLLIRRASGLYELRDDGELHDPSGAFVPNTLVPVLNENPDDKAEVMSVLVEWLDSEEEAISLLRHLATSLAPGWPAVKYILLLGGGRNGKGVLLSMLEAIFGKDNCSSVTRQEMSSASPVVTDLNGKLANIVFDGLARYVEDSSIEKTLTAGEPVGIRRLYRSEHTPVRTSALFIEGLNQEPRSRDKSSALQARLVRFHFPNTYPLNPAFMSKMTSERYTGALLALMLDNYVTAENAATMLAPTAKSMDLQLEYLYGNSFALPFLEYVHYNDPLGVDGLIGLNAQQLAAQFNAWRVKENDIRHRSVAEVLDLFKSVFEIDRRSERVPGAGPRKVRFVAGLKPETQIFIAQQNNKEEQDDGTLVED